MAIADDFSVDASKNIRHVSGTARYTVLAKHAWTQDMLDDASDASAGDNVSMESDNLGVRDGGRRREQGTKRIGLTDHARIVMIRQTASRPYRIRPPSIAMHWPVT